MPSFNMDVENKKKIFQFQVVKSHDGSSRPCIMVNGKPIYVKSHGLNNNNPLKTPEVRSPLRLILPKSAAENGNNNKPPEAPKDVNIMVNRKPVCIQLPAGLSNPEKELAVKQSTQPEDPPVKENVQPGKKEPKKTGGKGNTPPSNPPKQKKGTADDSDKWNEEQTYEVIMAVQAHPCLYDTTNEDFKNRVKRSDSWKEVADQVGLFREGETKVSEVQDKWHSLRTHFVREQKKIRESSSTGASGNQTYKPRMKFSEEMMFIKDFVDIRRTVDSGADDIFDAIIGEDEACDNSSLSEGKKVPGPPVKRRKSASTDTQFVEVLKQAGSAFASIANRDSEKSTPKQTGKPEDSFDHFSSYIASKLREMSPENATQTEKLLMEALFKMAK